MREANEAPKKQHPTKDTITQLRGDINARRPEARRILAKSGINPDSEEPQIQRSVINLAGNLLRKDLESGYDLLTKLPLRDYYLRLRNKFIAKGASEGLPMAIINIDLDGLKKTNDVYGHAAGNARIKETVRVAQEMLRDGDLLGRLGGDEFEGVVVVTPEDTVLLKERIDQGFRDNKVRASVGIAVVDPQDVQASTEAADKHMYTEKRKMKRSIKLEADLERLTHNG